MSWGAAAPIHSNVAAPVIGDSTMPSRFPLWSCRVLVLAASASPLLGCKKAGSASGDSRVEMSDARLTVLAPQKYRLAVKYRLCRGNQVNKRREPATQTSVTDKRVRVDWLSFSKGIKAAFNPKEPCTANSLSLGRFSRGI